MSSRPKTHFVMDDRGLGGTFMIQQQFLDMYRKIHQASKSVDDEPPRTTVLHRPYFSRFGEYYNRIPPNPINQRATAVVDTSAPESYGLIANLYINQGAREEGARRKRRNKKQGDKKKAESEGKSGGRPPSAGSRPSSSRPSSARSRPEPNATTAARRDYSSIQDIRYSLDNYVEECARRKKTINEEMAQLHKRRLLRLKGVTTAAAHALPLHRPCTAHAAPAPPSGPSTPSVAKAVMESIDRVENQRNASAVAAAQREEQKLLQADAQDAYCEEGEELTPPRTMTMAVATAGGGSQVIPPTPPKKALPTNAGRGSKRSSVQEFGPPLSQLQVKKKDVWNRKPPSYPGEKTSSPSSSSPSPSRYQHRSPSGTAAAAPGTCTGFVPSSATLVSPYGDEEDW